ncbi:MAG: hypothetical protein KKH41_02265 [Candidatus Thermoplasmatota archaeon]|nr:hypothetical protein [Euryarchaeota archaeon]MBU4031786.1 hypothetical protein [Candidatus Thermoplasmatota archaeon]MBU4071701.1 hypothetical protein [Candidatus Thermoplasmatota archaeon]MBU4143780.1 hypothetical protein [Candidatus Thermoplasmatota archaeon]MBU4591386.1 hypothetical protein [Candidatus Thermoplasmatota archaeon]
MPKEQWNYGMIDIAFDESEMPSYDDFMNLVDESLTEHGKLEPLFSGKIAEKNEYWTFVRHNIDPKGMYEFCNQKLSNVKSYSHCYHFKRFRGELLSNIMGGKHRYIGLTRLPDVEEFDESELKELMKGIEENTPFHVAWISKTHRLDGKNTYFFLTGNVEPNDMEKYRISIDKHIKASKSEIFRVQKFGHHKSHRESSEDKKKAIKEYIPEDHLDHEFLREYDLFHWSK